MEKHCDAVAGKDVESLVGLFRLLSDKTRLTILLLLAGGERNVSNLCKELELPQPTVSHHLGLLRMRNLIVNRRDGKQVYYGLNWHVRASSDLLNIDIDDLEISITRHAAE